MREFFGRFFEPSFRSGGEVPRKFFPGDQVKVMVDGAFKDGWVVIRDDSSRPNKNDLISVGLPKDSDQDLEGFAETMQVSQEKLMEWDQKEVK